MNLAIIPARGGSKRIPRKNIRSFAGRPIIDWSIAAAFDSGLFGHVLVSTDDPEIAEHAKDLGVMVPFMRPAELSDDHTGTVEVIAHAVNWAVQAGWQVEAACCIYATAPLISRDDIVMAYEQLKRGEWDFVVPAGRYDYPVQRSFVRRVDGAIELLFPENRLTRSQDLPLVYHDAGQFYWGRAGAWIEQRPILGDRSSFIELPMERIQDIDTPEDWSSAERLFEQMKRIGNDY